MKNYIVCDTHCDTATKAFDKNYSLFENPLHIDIKRMTEYKMYTPFFAVFISPEYYCNPVERCTEVINFIHKQAARNNVEICKNYFDLIQCRDNNSLSAFISIEGGEAVTKISDLKTYKKLGVSMLSLTWNNDNALGGGALGDGRGLSDFGAQVINFMNENKMIIDLSHANQKTFYDAINISKKPIILSHSNSYTICPNPRNITDKQFQKIIKSGSVVGINLYPPFLNGKNDANTSDVTKHIEHFLSLGGENNICIGTDFDGIDFLPANLCGIENIDIIFNELVKKGYNFQTLQKIAYKNIYRLISICL